MRVSYIFTASGLIALAACGGGEPQDSIQTDVPVTSATPALDTNEFHITPPADTPPASVQIDEYFLPGAIYGLSEATCTDIGGRYGQTTYQSKLSPYWCQMNGGPSSYVCGEDLTVTIGGLPGKFQMHLSGEDTFHPISMAHNDGVARWGGKKGTLSISDDQTSVSFEAGGAATDCVRYVYD